MITANSYTETVSSIDQTYYIFCNFQEKIVVLVLQSNKMQGDRCHNKERPTATGLQNWRNLKKIFG